jgi:hypothetical protein
METFRIRYPGWKKVGSGINIPDPQHCIFQCQESFLHSLIQTVPIQLRILTFTGKNFRIPFILTVLWLFLSFEDWRICKQKVIRKILGEKTYEEQYPTPHEVEKFDPDPQTSKEFVRIVIKVKGLFFSFLTSLKERIVADPDPGSGIGFFSGFRISDPEPIFFRA